MDMLNEKFLFASLIWGAIVSGYLVYAHRQRAIMPFLGGVAMIAASCMVASWFWMSVICIALIFGVRWMMSRGD